ncbi:MAG: lysine 5,6-aminomutase subunit alpha, partial [Clostridiales Family XIII bacterium]|nr:lysine 5,6-aminomutase subunit alpha [Clostridiales Family XIII bacterium]
MSKLNLDPQVVNGARNRAARIAENVQKFIDKHTTVSTERTVARLLGIDGVDALEWPLPNVFTDRIKDAGLLDRGCAYWVGNSVIATGLSPQQIAEETANGTLDPLKLPTVSAKEAEAALLPIVDEALKKIRAQREGREELLRTLGEGRRPYLYVIVATGNIYEDVVQARAAARQGADIIAVIRTTAQSLLDYVPYGPTTEGFGGTYATQENFRIMRAALDEVGNEVG